jgi:hypothetical protein
MAKQKYYHGTTIEEANNILEGVGCKERATWTVSDDTALYLWCPDALAEAEGNEDESEEYKKDQAIYLSFQSAQVTAAMSEKPQSELIVLCFEFDSKDVEEDYSCENMDHARVIELDSYAECLVEKYTCKHNSRLDALVLSGLMDNPNLNHSIISDDLLEACRALQGVWVESLYDFEWSISK